MKKLLLGAAAILALVGQATAGDVRYANGIEVGTVTVGGVSENYHGVFLKAEGHQDMGLSFLAMVESGQIGDGPIGTAAYEGADLLLAYRVPGFGVGPAVGWQYLGLAGLSEERIRVGVLGRHALPQGVTLGYSVLSDVDNFGKEFSARLTGEMPVTPDFLATASLERAQEGGSHANILAVGGRFSVVSNMEVTGELFHGRGRDAGTRIETTGLRAGVNFRF